MTPEQLELGKLINTAIRDISEYKAILDRFAADESAGRTLEIKIGAILLNSSKQTYLSTRVYNKTVSAFSKSLEEKVHEELLDTVHRLERIFQKEMTRLENEFKNI